MPEDRSSSWFPAGGPASLTVGQRRVRVFLATAVLLLLAGAAAGIDRSVSGWCVQGPCPAGLTAILDVIEPFGNGLGVLAVLIAVWCLDPARRWALPRLAACAYLAGLAANVMKMTVARTRPYAFDWQGNASTTFGEWLPLTSAGTAGQGFPSAHTATAVGLAVGLAWFYPRGRWLFAGLAVLVGCQRVVSGYHFPSDVLVGGALGLLVSSSCTHIGVLRRVFNAIERRGHPAGRALPGVADAAASREEPGDFPRLADVDADRTGGDSTGVNRERRSAAR